MYSLSPYYIESNDRGCGLWLFNTLTNKLCFLDKELTHEFSTHKKTLDRSDPISQLLIRHKFAFEDEGALIDEIQKIEAQKDKNDGVLYLTIIPTYSCNFRCAYCYEKHYQGVISQKTCEALVQAIENILPRFKGLNVEWFGGEPLIAINAIKKISASLIDACHKYSIPFVAGITTNGYFLTHDNLSTLIACKIVYYQITLDCFKEYHDSTRFLENGTGTFTKIWNNLINIKCNEKAAYIKITIRTNFTSESIAKKAEWEQFLANYLLDDKRFSYLPKYAWNNPLSKMKADSFVRFEYGSTVYDTDFQKESDNNLTKKLVTNKSILASLLLLKNNLRCHSSRSNYFIFMPDGSLGKCTVHLESDFNRIGILNEETKQFVFFENQLDYWTCISSEKCQKCKVYPICLGGASCIPKFKKTGTVYCSKIIGDITHKINCLNMKDDLYKQALLK